MSALELIIEREFNASVEQVFDAWSNPAQLSQWFGPRGCEPTDVQVDLRIGGKYSIEIETPTCETPIVRGEYLKIDRPNQIQFTWGWDHEAVSSGENMVVTVDFFKTDSGTKMRLHHINFAHEESKEHHTHGWTSSFDCLADIVGDAPLKAAAAS